MECKKIPKHQNDNEEVEQTSQYWLSSFNQFEKQLEELEKQINVLEDSISLDKIRQNRKILSGIVEDARLKILECNDISPPMAKENWHHILNSLTRPQLTKVRVSLQSWPKMKEILSPSLAMLNKWVNEDLQRDLESIINNMSVENQTLWRELCKIIDLDFAQPQFIEDTNTISSRVGSFRNCRHD